MSLDKTGGLLCSVLGSVCFHALCPLHYPHSNRSVSQFAFPIPPSLFPIYSHADTLSLRTPTLSPRFRLSLYLSTSLSRIPIYPSPVLRCRPVLSRVHISCRPLSLNLLLHSSPSTPLHSLSFLTLSRSPPPTPFSPYLSLLSQSRSESPASTGSLRSQQPEANCVAM